MRRLSICKLIQWGLAAGCLLAAGCSSDDKGDDTPWDVATVSRPAGRNSSKWISKIVEYNPAPGQWINEASFGSLEAAESLIGGKGMVSLGAFGGYIIFQFDHSVLNGEGYDFVIHGNAYDGSSEPGAVLVSADANGNGIADDPWYELAGGRHFDPDTAGSYTVTYHRPEVTDKAADVRWTDDTGGQGWISSEYIRIAHPHCYFPLFPDGGPQSLTFTGRRLASNLENKGSEEFPHWYLAATGTGYADNNSEDYPLVVAGDDDTARSNKFDISWAVDSDGNPVLIKSIDFIKVYTCVLAEAGSVGEVSTEICGAISLTAKQ